MKPKAAKASIDIGVVVQDVTKSLDFYVNILGLVPLGEISLPFGRLFRLSFGDSVLKLLVPTLPVVAHPSKLTERAGFQYITLQISNIDEFNEHLLANGIHVEMPLQELMPGLKVVMIHDPDGNIVELIERS